MKTKLDKLYFGLLSGVILPLIVLCGFYLFTYSFLTVPDFLRKLAFFEIILKLLSLCAISNAGLFFLFYHFEMDRAAKGVIFATFMYAFCVVIFKVINGTI